MSTCLISARSCRALIAAALLLPAIGGADAEPADVVVLTVGRGSYRAAADAAVAALSATGVSSRLIELGDDTAAALRSAPPKVVLTAGPPAREAAQQALADTPIVFMMETNLADSPLLGNLQPGQPVRGGVSAEPAPLEQLRWIRTSCPRVRRLAVLHSANTVRTVAALTEHGATLDVDVLGVQTSADDFLAALEQLEALNVDGVLMVLDAAVYNATTVQRLLLWGVHHDKAVYAFSHNVVSAGAFAGVAADADAVGRRAAELVGQVLRGGSPAPIGVVHPPLKRTLNRHTARLIGVEIPATLAATSELYGEDAP